ncbi:MAG: DUF3788 family protein [Treponemataceae bacterium]
MTNTPVLTDPSTFPDSVVLRGALQDSYSAYEALFERIAARTPEAVPEWKYYNDGKSWLLKTTLKKKTLFWLSAERGYFHASFYLGLEFEPLIINSDLPKTMKDQYAASTGKKIRGITARVERIEDLAYFDTLMDWKLGRSGSR